METHGIKPSITIKSNIGIREPTENIDHRHWKVDVLDNHKVTTKIAEDALIDARITEEKASKILNESMELRKQWDSFSANFSLACKKLGTRIADDEVHQEYSKFYTDSKERVKNNHLLPTRASKAKSQRKYTMDK
jgi:hypothetical protein